MFLHFQNQKSFLGSHTSIRNGTIVEIVPEPPPVPPWCLFCTIELQLPSDICSYKCSKEGIRRRAFLFLCTHRPSPFPQHPNPHLILIPPCIKRTDVGKLINKSSGDSQVALALAGGILAIRSPSTTPKGTAATSS